MGNSYSCQLDPVDGRDLLLAAEAGNAPEVGLFLFQDVNYLRYRSSFGRNSAWHKASKGGKLPVLKSMANVVTRQFDPAKDLDAAAAVLQKLGGTPKEVMGKLVNVGNSRGYTPLMLACRGGHTEVVQFLLANGADVFKKDRIRRQTCLHFAAEAGHADCIRMLISMAGQMLNRHQKRLIDVGNHAGLTALHYAAYCDQPECMKLLISLDANINAQADFADLDWQHVNAGDTPMHLAAATGNIEAIRILLKSHQELGGAMLPSAGVPVPNRERRFRDPRAFRNDYGRLPYHVAVRRGHTYLTEMLDPSVPVRYLLSGEELSTSSLYGPPRLAVLAAAALHTKLVADLHRIQAEMAQRAEAAAAAAAATADDLGSGSKGGKAWQLGSAKGSKAEVLGWQPEQQGIGSFTIAAFAGSSATSTPAAAAAAAAPANSAGASDADAEPGTSAAAAAGKPGHRRSWSWGSRRSTSLQELGLRLRLSMAHSKDGTDDADAAAATPGTAVVPVTPPSVPGQWGPAGQLPVTREASDELCALIDDGDGSAAAADDACSSGLAVAHPGCSSPRELLQLADGAVSVLLRALPGRRQSLQQDGNASFAAEASTSTAAPAAGAANVYVSIAASPRDNDSGAVTGVTPTNRQVTPARSWRSPRPSTEQPRLGRSSTRVTSPRGAGFGSSMFSVFGSSSQQQQEGAPEDTPASPAVDGAESAGYGARRLQRCFSSPVEQGSCSTAQVSTSDDAGGDKVSPNPDLLVEGNDTSSLLGAVLKPFRRSHRVVPVLASASMSCAASDVDDAATCGICLDCAPCAVIGPCKHQMCAECALDMCKRYSMSSAVCPFCRAVVAGFSLAADH